MGKIEQTMRSEITRLACKEIRSAVDPLRREVRELKRAVRELTRTTASQQKTLAALQAAPAAKQTAPTAPVEAAKPARLSPRLIKKLREKRGREAFRICEGSIAVEVWLSGAEA